MIALDILFPLYRFGCIFLPCLIYQWFSLRKKQEQIFISSMLWRYIFLFYLYLVIDVTGVGTLEDIFSYPELIRPGEINLIPFQSGVGLLNILNIIMFAPLGFLLPLIWEQCRKLWSTALLGFQFSLMIELLQLFNRRATDIDDLLMNTVGTLIGFLIWLLYQKLFGKIPQQINAFSKREPHIYLVLSLAGIFLFFHWRFFL